MIRSLVLAVVCFAAPLIASAEAISEFQSLLSLDPDSSLHVTEWITYDFEDEERHGIFRTIPLTHPSGSERLFHTRYIDIEVTGVRITDGADPHGDIPYLDVPYEITESGAELVVKIGDPDRTITGVHTYQIDYTASGALSYHPDGSIDLYWNATGNDWEVPILHANARVPDYDGLYTNEGACYQGAVGATDPCELEASDGTVDYTATDLSPGEGLTIARAVDPQKVAHVVLERLSLTVFWLIASGVWCIGLLVFMYRYLTAHRTGRTIIAQYEPYEGMKPMYTGLLVNGHLDPADVTAGIVYLAEQGFFKITRTERKKFFVFDIDDYEITLRRPYDETRSEFQKRLFTLLFGRDASIGSTILLSALAEDTAKQRENYTILQDLKKAAEADLIAHGFFEYRYRTLFKILGVLLCAIAVGLLVTAALGAAMMPPVVIASIVFVVSAILLTLMYRRRTRKGYEALDHLKGFKEFLSVTDAERFTFHNAPAKSPEQFMAYLPYAIAFGVEKEWALVFRDITIPEPEWYDGHGAIFSVVQFSNSLDAFSTTLQSASGAAPSSGGGSAGGGAGGGGGGSW